MENNKFIFLGGFHRRRTSEDEGQHLQTIYEPAPSLGGPGKFAFDKRAYMNEFHSLAIANQFGYIAIPSEL